MSIRAHLPVGYVAPYDFDLARFIPTNTPANTPANHPHSTPPVTAWTTTALDDEGTPVTYAITVVEPGPAALATITHAAARPAPLQHPYRKDVGVAAAVADWVDAIALAEGAGRRVSNQGSWADDGLAAAVDRATHRIVAYDDRELATPDPAALRAWLDHALSGTQVRVEVCALREFAPQAGRRIEDETLLRRFEDDAVVGWLPLTVTTDDDPRTWLSRERSAANGTLLRARPTVTVRTSGAARTWLAADFALSWTALTAQATMTADLTDADWLAVHVVGSDVALVFPFASAQVRVQTDDDGAMVTISVAAAELREQAHRRRADFERVWGPWLDPTFPLSDVELTRGIAEAQTLFHNAEVRR